MRRTVGELFERELKLGRWNHPRGLETVHWRDLHHRHWKGLMKVSPVLKLEEELEERMAGK